MIRPPPLRPSSSPAPSGNSSPDHESALRIVSGLPDDLTKRELRALFLLAAGCSATDILHSEHGIIAVAKFVSKQSAADARNSLNGKKLDDSLLPLAVEITNRAHSESSATSIDQHHHQHHPFPYPSSFLSPSFAPSKVYPSSDSSSSSYKPPKIDDPAYAAFHSVSAAILPNGRQTFASVIGDSAHFHSTSPPNGSSAAPYITGKSVLLQEATDDPLPSYVNHPQNRPAVHRSISASAQRPRPSAINPELLTQYSRPIRPSQSPTIPPQFPRVSANPADQNPPCNTLYVGNLPMNTREDELKALFSSRLGYKRLCFRTKAQGPMCFVEFDNEDYSTAALAELQGHMLTNSNKGGIRLSYSKNPLGVRNSQHHQNHQDYPPLFSPLQPLPPASYFSSSSFSSR